MSLIMEQIKPEQKLLNLTLFTLKCRPVSTKHGHNIHVYDIEILDEFKSYSNIWSYLPLNKEKLFNLTLFTLASTNNNQSAPNLVTMYGTVRS